MKPAILAGVIAASIFQAPTPDPRLTVPTGRICVLCDFGETAASPSLYSVQGSTVGIGLLAEGADGDLYGTSPVGGGAGVGTVFKVTRTGQLTTLHSFDPAWGAQPEGGLIAERDSLDKPTGTFYGTTLRGGVVQAKPRLSGTIFGVRAGTGGAASSMNVLYNFRNGSVEGLPMRYCPTPKTCTYDAQAYLDASASFPNAAPVVGGDGNLYGIATVGSTNFGVIYRIPKGGGDSSFKALCAGGTLSPGQSMPFPQIQATCMLNGVNKNSPTSLVAGYANTLYGTIVGGTTANPHGMVFQATLDGKVSILHQFNGTNGSAPFSVIQATDSFLYGTTFRGGAANAGVVFSLTRTSGKWIYKVLLDFGTAATFGTNPFAGLVDGKVAVPNTPGLVPDGYLYGVTKGGVGLSSNGIIFRIKRDGTDFKLLHTFPNDPRAGMITFPQGRMPIAPLLVHSDGNFYGTTTLGGAKNAGVLYQLSGVNLALTNQPGTIYTVVGSTITADGKPYPILVQQSSPAKDDAFVEVRTGEAIGQINPNCFDKQADGSPSKNRKSTTTGACILDKLTDDMIRIDVKNCRSPHIVQFIKRLEESLTGMPLAGKTGQNRPCGLGSQVLSEYDLGKWQTDAGCGKPNAYYDQNPGAARVYGPNSNPGNTPVKGVFSMSVWDQPTLSGDSTHRSIAEFKSFVFCNCTAVSLVNWSRTQEGTKPAAYSVASITAPTTADIKWMTDQLVIDKFGPVPTLSLSTAGVIK